MSNFTIPGGKEKGIPVEQASANTRMYWATRIKQNLDAGTSQNASYDKQLLAALTAVDAVGSEPRHTRPGTGTRAQPPPGASQQQPPPQTRGAMARVDDAQLAQITGTFDTRDAIGQMLRRAASLGTLIAPQSVVGELPIGTALAATVVPIDVTKETYPVQGGRTLAKSALMRICAAADISWDPVHSRRTDDGSDPHYCAWQAYGFARNFDGSPRGIMGSAALDLRDGSARVQATAARAAEKGKPNEELAMMRQFIERHTEARAMNAAIRNYAARPMQWSNDDLQKPLIVVKLIFTGRSDNPEVQRIFAERMFDAFHGARNILYGQQPQQLSSSAQHAPPAPLTSSGYDDHDEHGVVDEPRDQNDHDDQAQGDDNFSGDWLGDEPNLHT